MYRIYKKALVGFDKTDQVFDLLSAAVRHCENNLTNWLILEEAGEYTSQISDLCKDLTESISDLPTRTLPSVFAFLEKYAGNKSLVGTWMFDALDVEPPNNYRFTICPIDSDVGARCKEVLKLTKDLVNLMPDVSVNQHWAKAYEQCEIFYCG